MNDKDKLSESSDPKQEALRRLDKVLEDFKDVSSKRGQITPEEQHQYSERLIHSVDDALEGGLWERSLFLRAIGSKLKSVREYFKGTFSRTVNIADSGLTMAQLAVKHGTRALPETEVEVYISLYCASGRDVKSWEKLIITMGRQIVTRPILKNEDDVRELIRSKTNPLNEAYIAVRIKKRDIVNPVGGIVLKDPLGHALLTVRDGCLSLDNVERFVHVSGIYSLKDNTLHRYGDADFIMK